MAAVVWVSSGRPLSVRPLFSGYVPWLFPFVLSLEKQKQNCRYRTRSSHVSRVQSITSRCTIVDESLNKSLIDFLVVARVRQRLRKGETDSENEENRVKSSRKRCERTCCQSGFPDKLMAVRGRKTRKSKRKKERKKERKVAAVCFERTKREQVVALG